MRFYIIASVLVLLTACDDKETRLQSFLLKGNTSLSESDTDKALFYYNEALKLDSCFADALNNAGTIQHKFAHYDEAIVLYSRAVSCHPEYLPARFNRANSYYESGENFSAIADLDHILKSKPDTAAAWFLKGLVQSKQGDYISALTSFQTALDRKYPNEIECRVNIAATKFELKRYDEAKTELEQLQGSATDQPEIYNTLALIAVEQDENEKALRLFNQAIELNPKQPYFINNRGLVYINLGKLDEAEKDIDQSMMLDPYNAWAYRNKGVLMLKKKDYANAERLLLKAKEMDDHVDKVDEYLLEVRSKK